MDNKQMISCLEGMAEYIVRSFENGEDLDTDAQLAQAFAQICTAIAALNAPKPFIQIGREIFNRADIVRVAIEKKYRNRQEVCVYTKEIQAGPEGEAMSYSFSRSYDLESDEAKALLSWLRPQVELLASYSEDSSDEEDEELSYEGSVNREFQQEDGECDDFSF